MKWIIPILCREGDDCEICGVVLHDARSELLLSEGRNLVILINNINHQSRLSFQNITPWKTKMIFVHTPKIFKRYLQFDHGVNISFRSNPHCK